MPASFTYPAAEIVIVGAGGMGALFGSILQNNGLKVTLLDTDAQHVEAINRSGLSISGYGGERVEFIPALTDSHSVSRADIILFQCKSHGTTAAAQSIRHLVEDGAVCISFQNGLGNEQAIAEVVGSENVLGGLTAMAGYMTEPGKIRDFSRVPSWIGEMQGGGSERVSQIAAVLSEAGLETIASDDIQYAIWKKLLGNIAMSAVSGISNLTAAQCLQLTELKQTSLRALDEALAVASTVGITLNREDAVNGMEMISAVGGTGDNKSSLCVDLLNQRLTEVDYIYGSVIKLATENDVEVPTLHTLLSLVKAMESHYANR